MTFPFKTDLLILSRTMMLHRWDWYTLDPQTYTYNQGQRDQAVIDSLSDKLRAAGYGQEVEELYKKYRDNFKRY